ncbi:MAG: hypothetical protein QXP38_10730 [Nitrososphaerota archaeon]
MSSYKAGEFLDYEGYGVGRIKSVREGPTPDVEIDFKEKGVRVFPENLVRRNSRRLSSDGFHAYYYLEPEQARRLLDEDKVEVVCKVLRDFHEFCAKGEEIKEYLSRYISEWKPWWDTTLPLLKKSSRIDSTNLRSKGFRLLNQEVSPVEASYRQFRQSRVYNDQSGTFENACQVLRLLEEGHSLDDYKVDDVVNYLISVVNSDKHPINQRLEGLFCLRSRRRISDAQFVENFDKLIRTGFRIYELSPSNQLRVVNSLTNQYADMPDPEIKELLLTGVCAKGKTIEYLKDWAISRSDIELIAEMVIFALTKNLSPALEKEEYSDLNIRMLACVELVKCLPLSDHRWIEIANAFKNAVKILSSMTNLEIINSLTLLAQELHTRALQLKDENIKYAIIEGLVDPWIPPDFVIAVLDTAQESGFEDFARAIREHIIENSEKSDYRDDLLYKTLVRGWNGDYLSMIENLRTLVLKQSPNLPFIRVAGKVLCDIAESLDEISLIDLIPCLNFFYSLSSFYPFASLPWKNSIEVLLEKAYYSYLKANHIDSVFTNKFEEVAVKRALKRYASEWFEPYHAQEIQYKSRIQELEKTLEEKEILLRELLISSKNETRRFEERSRILKEVVTIISEIESSYGDHTDNLGVIEHILHRFEDLAIKHGVTPLEPLGTRVSFDPQRHRSIPGERINPGEEAIVIERGFGINDFWGRHHVLKPALVIKKG